jgi:hypothetical protein
MYRESRYIARAALDWQADRLNRFKGGIEYSRYSVARYQSVLVFPEGDAYAERPTRWAAYVQDRLDLGDLVFVGGLRLDRFSTGADRPFLLDTFPDSPNFGRYVSAWNPRYVGSASDGRELSIRLPDRWHGYLSPHLQVSFPVTQRTNFRLSYAHQVQAPDFALLLTGLNIAGIGADLDFGKTIAFEFGVRHAFDDDMVLDLAAYNKDNVANPALRTTRAWDPVTQLPTAPQRMTTADFGNTRGLDVRLDRRLGHWFNGTVGYSYQTARSTASDPFTNELAAARALDQLADVIGPPPQAILATTFSRPHSLTAALSVSVPQGWRGERWIGGVLSGVTLFSTLRLTSGTAYTRCPDGLANSSVLSEDECVQRGERMNAARLPTFKQVDLRATKGFRLGSLDVIAYLDVRNLLNARNLLRVFAATGGPTSAGDRQQAWATDSALYYAAGGANGVLTADGGLDLGFQGAAASGCGTWVSAGGEPAVPDCVYLIRAEERFGNGDHVFGVAEQRRASDARYAVDRGPYNYTDEPRRLRTGLEVAF